MLRVLDENYTGILRQTYKNSLPAFADLVCYWFHKAGELVAGGRIARAGLVATNSIRGGKSRTVLERIAECSTIFEAWSNEPWVVDGVAVRVSLVCFAPKDAGFPAYLDGTEVSRINTDLTAGALDLTKARKLPKNSQTAFIGDQKSGPFDIPGDLARQWLRLPANPNERPNSDVLKPWMNGMDVTRYPRYMWIVDFGSEMSVADAALYEEPFAYVQKHVWSMKQNSKVKGIQDFWWRHWCPRPEMWKAIDGMSRYIATPMVAKHRLFVWLDARICPDQKLVVIARDDDTVFGVLHSRFHEAWSLRLGTSLEDRPRYNANHHFRDLSFPKGAFARRARRRLR